VSEQPTLFPPPPATGQLTDRQRFVYDGLLAHSVQGEGLTSDEAGALLHERSGKHDAGVRCDWCGQDGKGVLGALRKKGLAKRRQSGVWVVLAPEGADSPSPASDPFPEGY
jgi:hypothetical protein